MHKSQEQQQAIIATTFMQEPLAASSITDQQMVQAAILADPSIDDCVVLNRAKESTREFVAYVVSRGKFSREQIQSGLQATLPSDLLPIAYVPLSKLPLTPTGEVDEQALIALEVVDSDLLQRWETQLQSLPEIEQAALVVQEYIESSLPLHLSDLLPDWKSAPSTSAATTITTASSFDAIEEATESKALAISYGGSLPQEPDAPITLPEVLQRAARQMHEDSIVYLQPDGAEIFQSYGALLEEAERILAGLRKLGLKPQNKVIFQLEFNQDIIPAFWGCILGGFIPVIMGIAPTYSSSNNAVDKLCNVWQLLDQPLILTTQALQKSVQSLTQLLPAEDFQVSSIEVLRKNNPDKSYHPCNPNDPAFFNLTSGSTGMPKCISLTHWNLISRAIGTNILSQHDREDVILNWLPFDHIGSISDWHIRCVYLGCQLIYATKEYILGRPLNWLDLINKYRITHSWAPNFAYALIYDALKQEPKHKWDLSCVKSLLTAGEAVSSTAVKDFIESLAIHGFKKTAIRPAFGMAEMGSGITYYQPTEENPLLFHTVNKSSLNGSIKRVSTEHPNCSTFTDLGPVIPGVSIRIVDKENSVLSEDTIGCLQVKGDAVFAGYYKNPEVNKEVFVENGWFNTGDLGFLSNGHLVVTGRAKETIIINGANYYNHEIEAVVEEIERVDVSYTAACAVRDAKGTTDKLAIFFSASGVEQENLIELLKQIRQTVVGKVGVNPDYLIPVEKDVIPKTAIGKIQRSQLSKLFEAGEFDSILKRLDILLKNANTLPDWFYRKTWRPKEVVSLNTQPLTGQTLVFLDSLGMGELICAELRRQFQPCVTVEIGSDFAKLKSDRYQINPQNPDHYQQLLESLSEYSLQIGQILHLWNYDNYAGEILSPEELEQALEGGIYSLVFLVQALAKVQGSEHQVRLLVAASHSQPTSPSDKVAAQKAPMLGALKAVSQEMSWLDCRHVDLSLDAVEKNAAHILRELRVLQRSPEVAYRHDQRLVPCLEKVDWSQDVRQELPFKQGGMYLLSGGLGGIGVEIAKYLLENYSARLLLVGRTPLPERSGWETVLKEKNAVAGRIEAYLSLEQLGGEISYQAVDICDRIQLQQVVEQAKSVWQCEIDGVIHLAGTTQECLLAEETRDSLAATLRPKVLGTWVLHQLVKNQLNSVFISSSSVNSFFGGTGAGAYAGANSFLDSFSHYQRYQCSLQSYCFAWSMWDEVGMSRGYQMKELSRAQGYDLITIQKGMHSLLVGLHHDQGQLLVGLDGSNRNIRRYIEPQLYRVQTLSAYFTANTNLVSQAQLEALLECDRYGTPSTCTFRQIQSMPLTSAGKIDREQLAAMSHRSKAEQVKPRTELEYQLASIWQEVLGISSLGIHDSFFELGGNSLLTTQVISRLRDIFEIEISPRSLFENSTIAELSVVVEEMLKEQLEEWNEDQIPSLLQSRLSTNQLALFEKRLQGESQNTSKTQTIPLRSKQNFVSLSFSQQRLWFLDQLEPNTSTYNLAAALRLTGLLNVNALEQSLKQIVQRHEVLRTTFSQLEGQPVQVIASDITLTLPVIDLHGISESERESKAQQLATKEAQKPFNLAQGPLIRATLLKVREDEHILLLTWHHIIFDGWSRGVFFQELSALYEGYSNNRSFTLPNLPIQYADFAHWQQQHLQGQVLESQLSYWKQQLGGDLPILQLPTARPRPTTVAVQGASHAFVLKKPLIDKLKALSQQENATLFMTLLAAFKTLLYRYTGQDDLLIGSPIANRNRSEVEGLIGFFVNTLVMRTNLSGNPSFRDLLSRVRKIALEAYEHQDMPFEKLVEVLQPERNLSHTPLFQVMFVLHNTSMPVFDLSSLKLQALDVDSGTAKFDITLSMEESESELKCFWQYKTDLFDPATITRMTGHFQFLLEAIVADREQCLSELPLLTAAERHQLLVEWNNTQTEYSHNQCIHQLFADQVERTPESVALVFEDEQLTYRELNARANQLAHYLQALGVGPDVMVGICVERSIEMIVGLLGILKAGGAYVPLDPTYPKERLAVILSNLQAPVLLTQERLMNGLPEHRARVVCLDTNWELIAQASEANPVSEVTANNLVYIIHTSGSTGQPKGVAIEHRQLLNYINGIVERLALPSNASFALVSTFSADLGNTVLFPALCTGGCLHVISQERASNPGAIADYFRYHNGIDCLKIVPSHLSALLGSSQHPAEILPRRRLVLGGEATHWELIEQIRELAPNCTVLNHYGPTETTVGVLTYQVGHDRSDYLSATIPLGRPLPNSQIFLLDAHLQPVPIGVPGEVYIGGAGLAREYLNQPQLTAQKFIPNPFYKPGNLPRSSDRVYKTGDLARYLPDGNIEFLGRIDHQVKIRGFRIELGEIEAVLAQHSNVRETLVIARVDQLGDNSLVAYVVPHQETTLSADELRRFLKQKLPSYMVPSAFMVLTSLPLTPNGKVDRRALPIPDQIRNESEKTFVPPGDLLERQLAKIWEQVLGKQPIGLRDDFFEIGGHSLLAVRLFTQIEQVFGKNLPLVTLFQASTVEKLANVLRQAEWSAPWSSLVTIQAGSSKPPLFCIHGGGFNILVYRDLANHLGPEQPVYGLQAQGLDGKASIHSRIEDMAADYIEQIRAVQPEGPYFLAGLSNGGVIALEMAQQLSTQGQSVGLVAMFDTHGPDYRKLLPPIPRLFSVLGYALRYLVPRFLDKLLRFGLQTTLTQQLKKRMHLKATSNRQISHASAEQLEASKATGSVQQPANSMSLLERWVHKTHMFVIERSPYAFYSQKTELQNIGSSFASVLQRIEQVHSDAQKAYVPKTYSDRITLFQASEQPPGFYHDPLLGWGRIAAGGLDIHKVPGHHSSIVQSPVTATKLKACLDKAQADI